ncbi:MAG: hypothetical protein ACE5HO_13970 [bacterium]
MNNTSYGRLILWVSILVLPVVWGCDRGTDVRTADTLVPFSAENSSCLQSDCHAGIEVIHRGTKLTCTQCHGGDETASTKVGAHVTTEFSFNPSTPSGNYIEQPTAGDLDSIFAASPEVLQFLNPSDYRVAMQTCGGGNGVDQGNCHASIVASSRVSTHATSAGIILGTLYVSGGINGTQPDKNLRYATHDVTDINWDRDFAPPYAAPSAIKAPEWDEDTDDPSKIGPHFRTYVNQKCMRCHAWGENFKRFGDYFSSGCNSCHLVTANDALSRSADKTQRKDEIGHPVKHQFVNQVPDQQCAHCHERGGRISVNFIGVRERAGGSANGKPNNKFPPHAERWNGVDALGNEWFVFDGSGHEVPEDLVGDPHVTDKNGNPLPHLYGRKFPFYISDENVTNNYDETPPDVHFVKGMRCVDCHVMQELHGERLVPNQDYELEVRCEDCHGTVLEPSRLLTSKGRPFEKAITGDDVVAPNEIVLQRTNNGEVWQTGKFDGKKHRVTQMVDVVDPNSPSFNPRTLDGCKLHTTQGNRMECFTCHSTWNVQCHGCHIEKDARKTGGSWLSTSGTKVAKITRDDRNWVIVDQGLLGFDYFGRIALMSDSAPALFTYIDANGDTVIHNQFPTSGGGYVGNGNSHNPFFPHTIQRQPRKCSACHPAPKSADPNDPSTWVNQEKVFEALGFGSGKYVLTDGNGKDHFLDRLVIPDLSGKLSEGNHRPAIEAQHPGFSGPLDAATINKILVNTVDMDQ